MNDYEYNQALEALYDFMDEFSLQITKFLEENNNALKELVKTAKEIKESYEDRTENR